MKEQANKSPTAVGAVSSAIAVHIASRRWFSFLRLGHVMRWKKRLLWICIVIASPVVLYFLTAPFILDILWTRSWEPNLKGHAYETSISWELYAPARAAVTRVWFGRGTYDYYCYNICHMGLLMGMEESEDDK